MQFTAEVVAEALAVVGLVGRPSVLAHIGQKLILGERQVADHVVERPDRRQLAAYVDGLLDVAWSEAGGECPRLRAVVFRYVLSATRNCQRIEKPEIVSVNVLGEALGRVTSMCLRTPQIEAFLCQPHHRVNGRDAVGLLEVVIAPLRDELDLVTQVGEAIVDRGRRQHEHLRASVGPDDLVHQPRVTIRARRCRAPVAEVVALVDDHQIECPPLQVFQVGVPAPPTAARQVRVVQHLVGESVLCQRVTFIIRLRP